MGPFVPRPVPIRACYPKPADVGSPPSVPALLPLSLQVYVEDCPTASFLVFCITPCICYHISPQCHIFHPRSHDLMIPMSEPCAQTHFWLTGVILWIRVPSMILDHAQLGGAVGIFSLSWCSFIPQLDL